jgi:quercetin dioxygenase-like cupin family protein
MNSLLLRIACSALLLGASMSATAQQAGISRVDLLQASLATPGRDVVQVRVGFAPGAVAARHRHPGEEVAFVLEGRIEYRIDGRPPIVLEAGQALFIPAGAVHMATNAGDAPAAELATYIVEHGAPLVSPAAPRAGAFFPGE